MSLKRHFGQNLLVEGLAIYRAKIATAIKLYLNGEGDKVVAIDDMNVTRNRKIAAQD